ncbi:MAG: hypothetical protein ACREV5_08660 [Steroidobacter sp.]
MATQRSGGTALRLHMLGPLRIYRGATTLPQHHTDDFLGAFRFTPEAQALFRRVARPIGFA